jgi:peptidyl-prolyl cis-trans isomerase B (cyclophilin B)
VPAYETATARRPFTATLVTNRGEVTFVALVDRAPCTSTSFRHLAAEKFFDGTACHRVTAALLQCGDPTGSGSGGPGYSVALENPPAGTRYPAGTVAMARTEDPDSNGSQFFVVYDDVTLPAYGGGGYSVFGRVTSGLDVVRGVGAAGAEPPGDGRPKSPLTIQSVRIAPGAAS